MVARRFAAEARAELERVRAPRRARALDAEKLLAATGARSIGKLWEELSARPYPAWTAPVIRARYDELCPGDAARVFAAAADALARRVDLLGSGPVRLEKPVDWHADPKTGHRWPLTYGRRLDLLELDRPSDVKLPWELSRLHWLLPAGQAYLLDGDERRSAATARIFSEWIDANPYARGVNWAIAMEAALRILSWTWLFHVFAGSEAWADERFRARFLCALYLHGDFVERHLEVAEVNGNHLAADAAGLVFAGLFFGRGAVPDRWQELGWRLLREELPRQVLADGVDFECSTAYHRLVAELFLLPALYRRTLGLDVPDGYAGRLRAAAGFAAAYSRPPDGSSPRWGDADDGRALPLGGQALDDHRYLVGVVGAAFGDDELLALAGGPRSEAVWLLGPDEAARIPTEPPAAPASLEFAQGGVWVLRGGRDHVFVDCGQVGTRGRGGHGHNDCLSFEAVLDGVRVVTDCGSYVYTADADARNRFRGTAAHNTPQVDGEEQNRLIAREVLWELREDALPRPLAWEPGDPIDRFRGAHTGYERLPRPVTPVRTLALDRAGHRLAVEDVFEGEGEHDVRVPLHLAEGGRVAGEDGPGSWLLDYEGRPFLLAWGDPAEWTAERCEGALSPSYGVSRPIERVELRRAGPLLSLLVVLCPLETAPADPLAWARSVLR